MTPDPAAAPDLAKLRHDLRTPVNHILGYSDLLGEELGDRGIPEPGDLAKIRAAARRMLEIVESLDKIHAPVHDTHPAPPATKPPATAPPVADPTAGPVDGRAGIRGKILVVDDDEGNRETLARRLDREGHKVGVAGDGQAALDALAASAFDLVLLDVMMPVLDGHAALVRMKGDPALRDIPVIMISALDELGSVIRCIESGAEDYLPKPFEPTLLRARIRACLEKKALRDQEIGHLRTIEETQARLKGELAEAARYVTSMLPDAMDEPLRVRWCFSPSTELGGDSFGYHWIDPSHFAIHLLDVCGHGVGAALLSVAASNVLRAQSLPGADFLSPASVLAALNTTFPMEDHGDMYFTIWYGVFDTATRTLRHACGGHPPAILLPPGGTPAAVGDPGMLIGVMPDSTFGEASLEIPPGGRLLVFSDGVYELRRPDGSMTSLDDLMAWARGRGTSDSLPDDALEWARATAAKTVLDDDFSLVCLDFPPP
jgi:phosphoserine phosphatase RsbU/P